MLSAIPLFPYDLIASLSSTRYRWISNMSIGLILAWWRIRDPGISCSGSVEVVSAHYPPHLDYSELNVRVICQWRPVTPTNTWINWYLVVGSVGIYYKLLCSQLNSSSDYQLELRVNIGVPGMGMFGGTNTQDTGNDQGYIEYQLLILSFNVLYWNCWRCVCFDYAMMERSFLPSWNIRPRPPNFPPTFPFHFAPPHFLFPSCFFFSFHPFISFVLITRVPFIQSLSEFRRCLVTPHLVQWPTSWSVEPFST